MSKSDLINSNCSILVPVWVLVVLRLNTRGIWLREFYLQAFDPVPAWWAPDHSPPGFARSLCLLVDQSWYLWNAQIFSLKITLKVAFLVLPINKIGASAQWCLISGHHLEVTFSKEDGETTEKQIRKTSVCKKYHFPVILESHWILYLFEMWKTGFVANCKMFLKFYKVEKYFTCGYESGLNLS